MKSLRLWGTGLLLIAYLWLSVSPARANMFGMDNPSELAGSLILLGGMALMIGLISFGIELVVVWWLLRKTGAKLLNLIFIVYGVNFVSRIPLLFVQDVLGYWWYSIFGLEMASYFVMMGVLEVGVVLIERWLYGLLFNKWKLGGVGRELTDSELWAVAIWPNVASALLSLAPLMFVGMIDFELDPTIWTKIK